MKPIAENRKALYEYNVLEKFEAGISLNGQEVKSIKTGRIDLKGTYVTLRQTGKETPEVFMIGANIPPYQPKNAPSSYDPYRERKLLLTKQEIKGLIGRTSQKGLTIIPLKVYTKKGKIKIEIALVKGKSKVDKRETIKKREIDRDIKSNIG
jgi:SsrA-binding protein